MDEARKKARKALVGIDEGHDPIAAKAKARVDDRQLFGVLVDEYLPVRARDMKPLSLEQTTLHLRKFWKPLHKLPLKKIDRATVAAELRSIAKEKRTALELWGAHVQTLLAQADGANVTLLRKPALGGAAWRRARSRPRCR